MKLLLKVLLCLVCALALAAGAGYASLRQTGETLANGPWRTNLTTGSAEAGLLHRARVAWRGLWALQSSEVYYFSAITDSDGQPLRHDCRYRVAGKDPDTRWWSVTAYNNDHFIPNPSHAYSFSKTTVQREADGSWNIYVSREPQPKNWLPSGDQTGELVLSLRCYNPGTNLITNPATIELPRIIREACQ
jgi:hypothetical protein